MLKQVVRVVFHIVGRSLNFDLINLRFHLQSTEWIHAMTQQQKHSTQMFQGTTFMVYSVRRRKHEFRMYTQTRRLNRMATERVCQMLGAVQISASTTREAKLSSS